MKFAHKETLYMNFVYVLHMAAILLREQCLVVEKCFKNHQNVPNMFIDISKNIEELWKNIQELSKNIQELSKNIWEISKIFERICKNIQNFVRKKKNLQSGP